MFAAIDGAVLVHCSVVLDDRGHPAALRRAHGQRQKSAQRMSYQSDPIAFDRGIVPERVDCARDFARPDRKVSVDPGREALSRHRGIARPGRTRLTVVFHEHRVVAGRGQLAALVGETLVSIASVYGAMQQDDRRMRSGRERHAVEILDRFSIRLELSIVNFDRMSLDRVSRNLCGGRSLCGWLAWITDGRWRANDDERTKISAAHASIPGNRGGRDARGLMASCKVARR